MHYSPSWWVCIRFKTRAASSRVHCIESTASFLVVLQDGVVPMDDDDDEDEEEEEEYLDDEASDDQWADGTGMQPFEWETAAPPVQTAWRTMPPLQDGLLFDDLLPMPGMRVDFGRAGGRRMQGMRMGGAPAAAAGVWDDAGDGMEGGLPDPMMAGG